MTIAALPESWQPPQRAEVEPITPPDRDTNDPAELAAWYGPFGWFESYRKVILANLRELERAKRSGERLTETRLDDLARCNAVYLNFLEKHLHGRLLWEQEVLKRGIGG